MELLRDKSGRFAKGNCGFWKNKHRERDEESPFWKGDNAGYGAKHMWVYSRWGKAIRCDNPNGCVYPKLSTRGKLMYRVKKYEWANISGEYKRIRSDWIMLCSSCHKRFDRDGHKF